MYENIKDQLAHPKIPGIEYYIDEYLEDDKNVIVRGWLYDNLHEEVPEVTAKNGEVSHKRVKRVDVREIKDWDIEDDLYGFEVKFDKKFKDNNALIFTDSLGNSNEVPLEISFFNSLGFLRNINKFSKYVTQYGFKNAIILLLKKKVQDKILYNREYILNLTQMNASEDSKEEFDYNPKISICMPVYNIKARYLRKAIESVLNQTYTNWELCIADDNSSMDYVRTVLNEYSSRFPQIKVRFRPENGHISEATNTALSMATGEYVAFMDDDDYLNPHTLHEYVKLINEFPDAEVIYCDEDKIDGIGMHYEPFHKNNWNRRLFFTHNFITHFVMVKRSLADKLGGLRSKTNGSQDYDYLLRAAELTGKIYHIPEILYSWRSIQGSAAKDNQAKSYAYSAGMAALQDSIDKEEVPAEVMVGKFPGTYKIKRKDKPKVTLMVPHENEAHMASIKSLNKCLKKSGYENLEVLALDYDKDYFLKLFPKYKKYANLKFIKTQGEGTWNRLQEAAKQAEGEYVLIAMPGVYPDNEDWISALVNETVFPEAGAITPRYLTQDETIYSVGYYLDREHDEIKYPERNTPHENMGYFFRACMPQFVEANLAQCFLMLKEDFLKLKEPDYLTEPYRGFGLGENVKKLGKVVAMTPEADLYYVPETTEKSLEWEEKQREMEHEKLVEHYPECGFDLSENYLSSNYYNNNYNTGTKKES